MSALPKMAGCVTIHNLLKFGAVLVWLLQGTNGEWGSPPFLSMDEFEEIIIDDSAVENGSLVTIPENIGHQTGFALFYMNLPGVKSTPTYIPTFSFLHVEQCERESNGLMETGWCFNATRQFDYEALGENTEGFYIQIKDNDSGNERTLNLKVLNVNEYPPVITTSPRIEDLDPIEELLEPEELPLILTVSADDADGNETLSYSVKEIGGQREDLFYLDDWKLKITQALNYSQRTSHRLNISVCDNQNPPKESSLIVTIVVKDVPNVAPEFIQTPTVTRVPESTKPDTGIASIKARDGDYGLNWNITYSLIHGMDFEPPWFGINPDTGEIFVAGDIDMENSEFNATEPIYKFTVWASEVIPEGYTDVPEIYTKSSHPVEVIIVDIDDQPPTFCEKDQSINLCTGQTKNFQFTIEETIAARSEIILDGNAVIHIVDLDSTPAYSIFEWSFSPETHPTIQQAFKLTPNVGRSNETFSLLVNDVNALDFDPVGSIWRGDDGQPTPQTFTVQFKGKNNPEFMAEATFTATVKDANDNAPRFELTQYNVSVCENMEDGQQLKIMGKKDDNYPNSCRSYQNTEKEIQVVAVDDDASPEFGTPSIIYCWSKGKQPMVTVDDAGKMIISSDDNFDFERNAEETFYLEAYDMYGDETSADKTFSTVPVKFQILDVNDEPLDVKFKNGNRGSVTEGDGASVGDEVLTGIVFRDIDDSANIQITGFMIGDQFVRSQNLSGDEWNKVSLLRAEPACDELKDKMQKWFDYKMVGSGGEKTLTLIVGAEVPDREGYGCNDVDRVDIVITADDLNKETPDQSVTITIPVTIIDTNDNPPESEGEAEVTVNLFETEDWNKTEQEPEYERLLFTLRVKDKDRNPGFTFSLSNPACELDEEICNEILDMFEISPETSTQGETKLFRKNGAKIDRDDRTYFLNDDEDIIALVLTASDGREDHVASTMISIVIEDRNDNTPILCDNYKEIYYNISELESEAIILATIQASDLDRKDKFGNVSYILEDSSGNCDDSCGCLDLISGGVKAIAKPNTYKWTMERQNCTLQIEARDYFRFSSSSGSNSVKTSIVIHIEDQNDHAPDLPVPSIPYRIKENETLDETIQVQDLDNPALGNGDFTVNIIDVTGSPEAESYFDLTVPPKGDEKNIKNVSFKTTVNMTGLCGKYNVTLEACDFWNYDNSMANCSSQLYVVEVANMNFNKPEFTYPVLEDETVPVHIEDVVIRQPIKTKNGTEMKNINANDKDKGCCCDNNKNGDVVYSIKGFSEIDCSRLLDINENTGMIFFTQKPTEDNENLQCELILEATDQGEESNRETTNITIVLLPKKNTSPYFGTASRVIEIVVVENKTEAEEGWKGSCAGDCGATDVDLKHGNYFDDQPEINYVYYSLRGGNSSLFEIEPHQTNKSDDVLTIKPIRRIDREMWGAVDGQFLYLNVSVYATNDPSDNPGSKDPQQITDADVQWAVISVKVDDIRDTPPSFKEKVIRAGFSTADKAEGEIGVIEAYDWDYNDSLNISISSQFEASEGLPNEGGTRPPFKLGNTQPVDGTNFFAQILVQFEPQPSHKGFYKFSVTATDSVAMSQTVECRIYAIADENILKFYFRNELDDLKPKFRRVAEIFSEAFNYPCNVDRAFIDAGVKEQGLVTLQTHFIDIDTDQPVAAEVIQAQQFDPDFYNSLTATLKKEGLDLYKIGDSEDLKDTDFGQIITYVLIGAIAVLTITLLILSASCYYNNRSLGLQVRALTANTFGSQQSDLNRVGTMDAPNTNAFTAEGSNPVWATSPGGFEPRGIPDFDTDSVGSGGSVLIGAEDEDYFQSSLRNPAAFQANDVVANFDEESYNDNDGVSQGGSANESPFPTKVTNNPLMNFGGQGMSFDADDNFGEEPFQFEGNSDANLF